MVAEATCQKCNLTWHSVQHCHCAGCCRHFLSLPAFEAHLRTEKQGSDLIITEHADPATLMRKDGQPLMEQAVGGGDVVGWRKITYRTVVVGEKARRDDPGTQIPDNRRRPSPPPRATPRKETS